MNGALLCALWLPFRYILWLILSPLVTIGFILFVVAIGLPAHLFRKAVSFVGHILDDDLESLVTAMGCITGRDFDDWGSKPSHSLTIVMKLKGDLELKTLQQLVIRNVVHKLNPTKEHLEYPELQQYCTKRLGYLFFKWDRQFNITNHVKLYKSPELNERAVVTEEKLMSIWEDLARAPYMPKRSPWEVLLVKNYVPGKDKESIVTTIEGLEKLPKEEQHNVVFIRVHHSLMDGISAYRFFLDIADGGSLKWDKERREMRTPKCYSLVQCLKALFLGPASSLFEFLHGLDYSNERLYKHTRSSGKYHVVETTLDLSTVKKVKDMHCVSFSSVIIAGITGGIKSYLTQKGLKLPLVPVRLAIPVPSPGHTLKLRNEWLSAMFRLPVDIKMPKHRLLCVDQRLEKLKSGSIIPYFSMSLRMIGGFPVQLIRLLTYKSPVTVLYSEMKGPDEALTILNSELFLESISYSFGLGTDNLGIGISTISYNGKLKFVLTLDSGIFATREQAEEFLNFIVNQIQEFQYWDSTNL